jgi:hypothetical protein
MNTDKKNDLMRKVLYDARYCIPDTIVETLVEVFGQYVLDQSSLTDKEKKAVLLKALDKDPY